jgi:phosphoribosylanthranilate isomerase
MRIKICGITNAVDGERAARFGADAIGLNFYTQSKRYISTATAREILRGLPPFVEPVALFVNQANREVLRWAEAFAGVRTLQIHGDLLEPIPESEFRWIPAFPVRDRDSLHAIIRYLNDGGRDTLPAAVLVDAHVAGEYGGTGQTLPWHVLADRPFDLPLILAGGLTAANVAEAIRIVRPFAIDVASGVESVPGQKDEEKMRRFITTAREAAAKYGI